MRDDLNKLLCERERHGHRACYGDVRHTRADNKLFDEDGEYMHQSRESMKRRHVLHGNRKSFSENLNPLYGLVRKNVNRPWNKVYSEICQNFNKDSVINQHILTHLFDFVDTKTKLDAKGKVLVHYWGGRWRELKDTWADYYVHPRTGILTFNKYKESWKAARRKAQEERRKAEAAKEVWLNDLHVAQLIDGQWFETLFDYQVITIVQEEVETPDGKMVMVDKKIPKYGYDSWSGIYMPAHGAKVVISYRQLSKREMKRYGLIKK